MLCSVGRVMEVAYQSLGVRCLLGGKCYSDENEVEVNCHGCGFQGKKVGGGQMEREEGINLH